MNWQLVIGLEVHVQLATQAKIFSSAPTSFGQQANSQVSAVDLGLPGVLPVVNQAAVDLAIRFGLAIDAPIAPTTVFARKHYFYPDSPKGYQISQLDAPIVGPGWLTLHSAFGPPKKIAITRAHLEEDAGKLIHHPEGKKSWVDLNRSGNPLLEVVSEPVMHSAKEAIAYLKTLHHLVRYLGIGCADMEKGAFRCDVNISVRPDSTAPLGTRTEIKNLNSFRFIEQAIHYEERRQIHLLENNQPVLQQTRLFDPANQQTRFMRSKEDAQDYRYLPDPDLPPININEAHVARIARDMPDLPEALQKKLLAHHKLQPIEAQNLSLDQHLSHFFEQTMQTCQATSSGVYQWIMGPLRHCLKTHQLGSYQNPIQPTQFADILNRLNQETLSSCGAKIILDKLMLPNPPLVCALIKQHNLALENNQTDVIKMAQDLLHSFPEQASAYRGGKHSLLSFFIGQGMQRTQGKMNPKRLSIELKSLLATN